MEDSTHAQRLQSDAPATSSKTIEPDLQLFTETVTIKRPPSELFAFWRNPSNLVEIMDNVISIEPIDENRSQWTVKAPGDTHVSWEAVITKTVPDEEIYWQSAPGAEVVNNGRIQFIDAGARGTVVRATIAYDPPGGTVGKAIAKLFQREPRIQARRDLHRMKQLMETGEIAISARNRRIASEREEDNT